MDVQYSPETRQWTDGLPLLEQASTLLASILGPRSSQLVKAAWDRAPDHQDRPLYRLTIRDAAGEVFMDFAPDELQNRLYMRVSLARLWGDLLAVRNNQQHRQVEIISGQVATG